ncbi:hypothetical protein SteCoe_24333 [Stentor coeruleus]|uniref:Uncharacterized protein n=1 Tax=Stentor coeruleus TaxID=5963 RepID=A0A1R2BHQ3_9CILI|nr:hypothetical protein SteCoe_24333 [Stentor coeruleus]
MAVIIIPIMIASELEYPCNDLPKPLERTSEVSQEFKPLSKIYQSLNANSRKPNIIEKMIKDIKQMRYVRGYHEALMIGKKLKMQNINKGNVFERLFSYADIKKAKIEHMNSIRENSSLSPILSPSFSPRLSPRLSSRLSPSFSLRLSPRLSLKNPSQVFSRLYKDSKTRLTRLKTEIPEKSISLTPTSRRSSTKFFFDKKNSLVSTPASSPKIFKQSQKPNEPDDPFLFCEDFSKTIKPTLDSPKSKSKCQTTRNLFRSKAILNRNLSKQLSLKLPNSNMLPMRDKVMKRLSVRACSPNMPTLRKNIKISIPKHGEIDQEKNKTKRLNNEDDEIEKAYGFPGKFKK